MSVLTSVTSSGALPVETIEVFLDRLEEVSACDDGIGDAAGLLTGVLVEIDGQSSGVLK